MWTKICRTTVCTFYWTEGPLEIIFFQAFTKNPSILSSGRRKVCVQHSRNPYVDCKAGHVKLPRSSMQKFTKMLAIQGNQPSLCSPLNSFYGRLLTFALYAILLFFRYGPNILSFLFFFLRGVTQNSMYYSRGGWPK